MNYLADTHILLWSFLETEKLSKKVKSILLDEGNIIYYSPMSLWEISIKYSLKKLSLNGGTPEDFFAELENSFFHCKAIEPSSLISNYKLPASSYHKDPFDRFLIWEAIRNDLVLLSVDSGIQMYKNEGLKFVY